MDTFVDIVEQHTYETLASAIERARYASRNRPQPDTPRPVHLRASVEGVMVEVGVETIDSSKDVQAKLELAYENRLEDEEQMEPDTEMPEGVPTGGEQVDWPQLHPALRAVVVAALRKERERFAQASAESAAQQIAVMSSMAELLHSSGEKGQVMAASMAAGMRQSMGGAEAGQKAICAAYDTAIEYLERL